MIELVIFDCDGVLIDSEIVAAKVWCNELKNIGLNYEISQFLQRFVGSTTAKALQILEAEYGRSWPSGFLDNLSKKVSEAFANELVTVEGIEEILSNFPLSKCVASNSTEKQLLNVLTITKLLKYFEPYVFSSSLVEKPKPAPDLFLLAAKTFNVNPKECLVIEDSVSGVTAATSAGMRVFGFTGATHSQPNQEHKLKEAGASLTFEQMKDLLSLIKSINE